MQWTELLAEYDDSEGCREHNIFNITAEKSQLTM